MEWIVIKKAIQISLKKRGLKNPNIRLNALENIEVLLDKNFPEYIMNPKKSFGSIDKKELKMMLSKFKDNGKLNSAESSVINQIYYCLC